MPIKPLVFAASLLPLVLLIYQGVTFQLGPDPGKTLVLASGEWSLRFLLLTLAMTPLRQLTKRPIWMRLRRMLGLYSWFYASVHLLAVLTYLLGWSLAIFLEEFTERPYMALGICAWVLMVPLGITSTRWMQKKLRRHWHSLHRLVYLIGMLACAHFIWLVRADYFDALIYSLVLVLLLAFRVWNSAWIRRFTINR